MQWWNDFVNWLTSNEGTRIVTTALVPFVAIIVAGVIAALIGRAATRRVLLHRDRELKAAAITALIRAGRKAAVWSSLGADERQHVDGLISEADIRIRLLPVNGANAAADWAAHELAGMKKHSATYSFQADQTFTDYRDRLLEWQDKPKRARKLFAFDLDQWRSDDQASDKSLVEKQQAWATKQVDGRAVDKTSAPEGGPVAAAAPTGASVVAPDAASTPPTVPSLPSAAAPTEAPASVDSSANEQNSSLAHERIDVDSAEQHAASMEGAGTADTTRVSETVAVVHDSSPDDDLSHEDEYEHASPVPAGSVRERAEPDVTIDEDR